MTFLRTTSGLSNLHIFSRSDLIVFTEGGSKTINMDGVIDGEMQNPGIDVTFWGELFKRVLPDVKVGFRSLGSKNALRVIAENVAADRIDHVCVAMDRDYDAHWGYLLRSRNVIYTRGYSWENELLAARVIENVFYELAMVDRALVRVRREIESAVRQSERDLRWLVYGDAILCAGGKSLFERRKVASAITSGAQSPRIRRSWLFGELRKKRTNLGKYMLARRGIKLDPRRDCFGKMIGLLAYRLLMYLMKKHSEQPSLSKHYAYIFLVKGVCEWLTVHRHSLASKYYFGRISRIVL